MGCTSSKHSIEVSNEDEEKQDSNVRGTIIVAFFWEQFILFGVDSRASNESRQDIEGEHEWKLRIHDNHTKLFAISSNIIAIMVGDARDSKAMCQHALRYLQKRKKVSNAPFQVEDVLETMSSYLTEVHNKGESKRFGAMIVGWDPIKKFQICSVNIRGDRIVKKRHEYLAALGSGTHYSMKFLGRHYNSSMPEDDAIELVLKSLFYATLSDKHCGGILHVYRLDESRIHDAKSQNAMEVYSEYYEDCNERNTLFIVYSSKYQPFSADDLITHLRQYGAMKVEAAHLVAHCESQNEGIAFYFHRLILETEKEATKIFRNVVKNALGFPSDGQFVDNALVFRAMRYRVLLNTKEMDVPVYVNKSSKQLLEVITSNAEVIYR